MISVQREDDNVVVTVKTELPHCDGGVSTFPFHFSCGGGHTEYAELLARHIEGRRGALFASVRQQAYERGWKDAKSKKCRKATEFSQDPDHVTDDYCCW